MEFKQEPDYNYLRGLFRSIMEKNNFKFDLEFDWMKKDISEINSPYFIEGLNSSINANNSNSSMQVGSKESNLNNENTPLKIKTESSRDKYMSKFSHFNE